MKTIFLLSLLFLFQTPREETYSVPANYKDTPVSYLKELRVHDPSRQLSEDERKSLVRLFVWSYVTSARKYKQDYYLDVDAPAYLLLKTNFPSLAQQEGEGGIMLGRITRFFNARPEYEPIVDSELQKRRNGLTRCKD